MGRGMGSARIIRRYILLQLPGFAGFVVFLLLLETWLPLPGWLLWTAIAAWAVKDAALYPFVWRAYDAPGAGAHPLVGATGYANERLDLAGYIKIRGELWKAVLPEGCPPVDKGGRVQVFAVDGLTLRVRPGTDSDDSGD